MRSFDKDSFLSLLKFRPQWLIGKRIIYDGKTIGIIDISVSGDCLLLESSKASTEWVPAGSLGDSIVVDVVDFPVDTGKGPFTVLSILRWIESLEKSVGQPDSEHPKPLYEIVAGLNKEMFELKTGTKGYAVPEYEPRGFTLNHNRITLQIKPFETICPGCLKEQVTSYLHFYISPVGSMTDAFDLLPQNDVSCTGCTGCYPWRKHLKNTKYILELNNIKN